MYTFFIVVSLVDTAKEFSKLTVFCLPAVRESFSCSTSLVTLINNRVGLFRFYNFIHSDGFATTSLWHCQGNKMMLYEYFLFLFMVRASSAKKIDIMIASIVFYSYLSSV